VRRIIAVANQKGGVGKTTTAVNLSAAFALAGRRVVLVDLDPQANATSGIGVEIAGESDVHLLLRSDNREGISKATGISGLGVVPSSPKLLNVESELGRHSDGNVRLARFLSASFVTEDFVVIDCAPSLGLLTRNALNAATSVLIPIQCEYYAIEGLARILGVVEEVRRASSSSLKVDGILLTMFDPGLELSHEVVSEVRTYFPDEVYETIIPRDVALSEASSHGRAVFEHAPRGPGSVAYLELAREVMANG
jgi:chromosome partitioning protein